MRTQDDGRGFRFLRALSEYLHIPFLFTPLLPFMAQWIYYYGSQEDRKHPVIAVLDAGVTRQHFLTGLWLIPVCIIVRLSERKFRSPAAFLAICGAILAALFFLTGGVDRILLLIISVLFMMDTFRFRVSENSRRRAVRENDPDWQEPSFLFLRPVLYWLAFPAILYIAALFQHNAVLCNEILLCAILYALCCLVYHRVCALQDYIEAHHGLENVPAGRIRRIGLAVTGGLIAVMLCTALLSAALGGKRIYLTEKPQVEQEALFTEEELENFFPAAGPGGMPEDLMGEGEAWEPPVWLQKLLDGIFYAIGFAILGAAAWGVILSIRRTLRIYRAREEENGDISVSLEPENDRIARIAQRAADLLPPRTEKERIRRKYRRTIRRARQEAPMQFETPAEIERGADLSSLPDPEAFHTEYERARYAP